MNRSEILTVAVFILLLVGLFVVMREPWREYEQVPEEPYTFEDCVAMCRTIADPDPARRMMEQKGIDPDEPLRLFKDDPE